MREIEQQFANICTWFIGNHNRGLGIVDSAKRYEFIVKALSNVIEMQGLLLQEIQRLNHRTANGFIQMPGTRRSIRGEVERDG
jgi:hypothetical protein